MFILTLGIIIVMFIVDMTLSLLNYKHRTSPIPANVRDVYDEKEYQNWLTYTMEVFRLSIIKKVVDTSILIIFLVTGVFPKLHNLSVLFSQEQRIQTLLFFGFYMIISYFIGLGFDLYSTFNLEERYGFNKTTPKTYILDTIKSTLLTCVLGGGLLYLIQSLFIKFGSTSLYFVWGLLIIIILVINILYTKVFIKIFNKLTPLEEGVLLTGAKALANGLGYEIKKVSIMDASKRSSRLNAFFTGFGKFKSIVLFDTLVEKCETDEILSVLAHEIGHAINKDTLKNTIISFVQLGFFLLVLSFFLSSDAFAVAFGFENMHFGFSIILFSILLEPLTMFIRIPLSALSRKAEYRADKVAKDAGYKEAMVRALKVLARENYSNLTPHPLLVKMTYSHPPISDRIQALEQ